jgi:integrase
MVSQGQFQIRGKLVDPRTGKEREVTKFVAAASAREAATMRTELLAQRMTVTTTRRVRVVDFAKCWIESKAGVVSRDTLVGYTGALDNHVVPELGDFYYDEVGHLEVQRWVNQCVYLKKPDGSPRFSVESVKDWFRVLRNMTRDAIAQLGLARDPTLRISFPEIPQAEDHGEADTTLTPEELHRFLSAMQRSRPSSYALARTLAFTGQRFCHVSALKWGDLDWDSTVIRFRRKQVRGMVGPISRKKPAPREIPMLADLAETLREHEQRAVKLGYPVGADDWVFPSKQRTLRTPASLVNAFRSSLKVAKINKRVTPHGLRYFFNDVLRMAGVDPVTGRSLTGHVTEQMREHYSTVRLDEKRDAMERVGRLLRDGKVGPEVGPEVGPGPKMKKAADPVKEKAA